MITVTVGATTYELWASSGGFIVKAAHGGPPINQQFVGLSVGKGQNALLWPRGAMRKIQEAVNRE